MVRSRGRSWFVFFMALFPVSTLSAGESVNAARIRDRADNEIPPPRANAEATGLGVSALPARLRHLAEDICAGPAAAKAIMRAMVPFDPGLPMAMMAEGGGDPDPNEELQEPDCRHDYDEPDITCAPKVTAVIFLPTPPSSGKQRVGVGVSVAFRAHGGLSPNIKGAPDHWTSEMTASSTTYTWSGDGTRDIDRSGEPSESRNTVTFDQIGDKHVAVAVSCSQRWTFTGIVSCTKCGEPKEVSKSLSPSGTATDTRDVKVFNGVEVRLDAAPRGYMPDETPIYFYADLANVHAACSHDGLSDCQLRWTNRGPFTPQAPGVQTYHDMPTGSRSRLHIHGHLSGTGTHTLSASCHGESDEVSIMVIALGGATLTPTPWYQWDPTTFQFQARTTPAGYEGYIGWSTSADGRNYGGAGSGATFELPLGKPSSRWVKAQLHNAQYGRSAKTMRVAVLAGDPGGGGGGGGGDDDDDDDGDDDGGGSGGGVAYRRTPTRPGPDYGVTGVPLFAEVGDHCGHNHNGRHGGESWYNSWMLSLGERRLICPSGKEMMSEIRLCRFPLGSVNACSVSLLDASDDWGCFFADLYTAVPVSPNDPEPEGGEEEPVVQDGFRRGDRLGQRGWSGGWWFVVRNPAKSIRALFGARQHGHKTDPENDATLYITRIEGEITEQKGMNPTLDLGVVLSDRLVADGLDSSLATLSLSVVGEGKVLVREAGGGDIFFKPAGEAQNPDGATRPNLWDRIADDGLPLMELLPWSAGPCELVARFTVGVNLIDEVRFPLEVKPLDLDVDSLNEKGLEAPARTDDEDDAEEDAPGKIFVVNTGNLDGDAIPDFADFTIALEDDQVLPFVPVALEVKSTPDILEKARVRFRYSASDPNDIEIEEEDGVTTYTLPAEGHLRLWRKNEGTRNPADAADGGDYFAADTWYELADLGLSPDADTATLFLEAVKVHTGAVIAEYDLDGEEGLDENINLPAFSDVVRVTAFQAEWVGPAMAYHESGDVDAPAVEARLFGVSDPAPQVVLALPTLPNGVEPGQTVTMSLRGEVHDPIADHVPSRSVAEGGADIESVKVYISGALAAEAAITRTDDGGSGLWRQRPYKGVFQADVPVTLGEGTQLIKVETTPNAEGFCGSQTFSIGFRKTVIPTTPPPPPPFIDHINLDYDKVGDILYYYRGQTPTVPAGAIGLARNPNAAGFEFAGSVSGFPVKVELPDPLPGESAEAVAVRFAYALHGEWRAYDWEFPVLSHTADRLSLRRECAEGLGRVRQVNLRLPASLSADAPDSMQLYYGDRPPLPDDPVLAEPAHAPGGLLFVGVPPSRPGVPADIQATVLIGQIHEEDEIWTTPAGGAFDFSETVDEMVRATLTVSSANDAAVNASWSLETVESDVDAGIFESAVYTSSATRTVTTTWTPVVKNVTGTMGTFTPYALRVTGFSGDVAENLEIRIPSMGVAGTLTARDGVHYLAGEGEDVAILYRVDDGAAGRFVLWYKDADGHLQRAGGGAGAQRGISAFRTSGAAPVPEAWIVHNGKPFKAFTFPDYAVRGQVFIDRNNDRAVDDRDAPAPNDTHPRAVPAMEFWKGEAEGFSKDVLDDFAPLLVRLHVGAEGIREFQDNQSKLVLTVRPFGVPAGGSDALELYAHAGSGLDHLTPAGQGHAAHAYRKIPVNQRGLFELPWDHPEQGSWYLFRAMRTGLYTVTLAVDDRKQGQLVILSKQMLNVRDIDDFYTTINMRSRVPDQKWLDYDFVVDDMALALLPELGLAYNNQSWIHVHGSKNSEESGRNLSRKIYKRMYWQGFGGHAFSLLWEGNYGHATPLEKVGNILTGLLGVLSEYEADFYNDFVYASMVAGDNDDLVDWITGLHAGNAGYGQHGQRIVMSSHSAGNNLVSQLIRKCPTGTISRFIKMQSAAPSSAYNNTQPPLSAKFNNEPISSEWDYLGSLADIPPKTEVVNLHSSNDSVLGIWEINERIGKLQNATIRNGFRNKRLRKGIIAPHQVGLMDFSYYYRSNYMASGKVAIQGGISNVLVEDVIDSHSKMNEAPLQDVWMYFTRMLQSFH